jgi:hypothetical protein
MSVSKICRQPNAFLQNAWQPDVYHSSSSERNRESNKKEIINSGDNLIKLLSPSLAIQKSKLEWLPTVAPRHSAK